MTNRVPVKDSLTALTVGPA